MANKYQNIDDVTGGTDTLATAPTSSDFIYTDNIATTGGASAAFTVNLGASGPRLAGSSTVRFNAFKTNAGVASNDGNDVTLTVRLLPGSGSTALATSTLNIPMTGTPTQYNFNVGAGVIPTADEARALLADTAPDKRARLIEQLLAENATRPADDILQNASRRQGAFFKVPPVLESPRSWL